MNTIVKRRLIPILIVAAFTLLGLVILTSKTFALSGSEFNAGRIIDDSVFYNSATMSPQQIQTFLNSKVPVCDTNGTQPIHGTTRAAYGASQGHPAPYICLKDYTQTVPTITNGGSDLCTGSISGGTKSAAVIIYDAAKACGINPKVLIVLLQKEQSLVTDDWPWDTQYRSATGYGCPDTAPCDSEYYGFFNQVYQAAKAFRRYEANPNSYNYKANRNNNIYYHPSLGACGSSNVFIQNQATANLYIYTPYQPNAAALNNLYGTGDGCSAYGNRNFWRLFNDWFGSTYAPLFGAEPAGQSVNPAVIQGKKASMYIRFKNTGNQPWYDAITASENNAYPVRLGTDISLNRSSLFGKYWPHPSRPSTTFGKIYSSNGSQIQNNHIVYPGQIAEFWFAFEPTLHVDPGKYTEAFRPVVEGHGPTNMSNNAYFNVKVVKADYRAEFFNQSSFPHLAQGQWSISHISYKNVGNVSWYDSVSSPGSKQLPIHLATDFPLNRKSTFSSNWAHPHRPSTSFKTVYESDGITLAQNQHITLPGQIAKFELIMQPKLTQKPGFYSEHFRPVLQGYGPMNNVGTWLGVYVYKASYKAAFAGQSSFPTIDQGDVASAHLMYKNVGNVIWYDSQTASGNLAKPVKLATDGALNRNSVFSNDWLAPHRPVGNFSAVYESDGVTLAQNQHAAAPGQVVRFGFNFTVAVSTQNGFYPEAFRPVVEGLGPMNNVGTWLGITVQ